MRKIIRKIKKNPTFNAPQLTSKLLEESGKKVTPQTMRNLLKEVGHNGKVSRKKPYVNEKNR